ncbi:MAG: hypothetical protein ABR980_05930 [Ignavibacteriaceae bacterium]
MFQFNEIKGIVYQICPNGFNSSICLAKPGSSFFTVFQTSFKFISSYSWIKRLRIPFISFQGRLGYFLLDSRLTLAEASPFISILLIKASRIK